MESNAGTATIDIADVVPVELGTTGRVAERASRAFGQIAIIVCGVLLVGLLVVVIQEVVLRLWFGGALPYSNELASWILTWIFLLGGSISVMDRSAPRITMVVDRVTPRAEAVLAVFRDGLGLFAFLYMTVYGYQLAAYALGQKSPLSGVSVVAVAASVPVAGFFMAVHRIVQLLERPRWSAGLSVGFVALCFVGASTHALDGLSYNVIYVMLGIILAVCLAIGTPVQESLLFTALMVFGLTDPYGTGITMAAQIYQHLQGFVLVAIPMFLMTGIIFAYSKAGENIGMLCKCLLGWLPGGLGIASVGASALLADISGSAAADSIALAKIFGKDMHDDGYPKGFTAALQACSAGLGVLIPPSISVLLFASVVTVSVRDAFAALILPAALLVVLMMVVCAVRAKRHGWGSRQPFAIRPLAIYLFKSTPALLCIVLILWGVFSGVFTATESGAFAVLFLVGVSLLGYRNKGQAFVRPVLKDSVSNLGRIGFLFAAAYVLGWVIIRNNGPANLVSALLSLSLPPVVLLILVYVCLGLIMIVIEPAPVILVAIPLIWPLLSQMGTDDLTFLVSVETIAAATLICPPLGLSLFLVSSTLETRYEEAVRHVWPFLLIMFIHNVIIAIWPAWSNWLPALLR